LLRQSWKPSRMRSGLMPDDARLEPATPSTATPTSPFDVFELVGGDEDEDEGEDVKYGVVEDAPAWCGLSPPPAVGPEQSFAFEQVIRSAVEERADEAAADPVEGFKQDGVKGEGEFLGAARAAGRQLSGGGSHESSSAKAAGQNDASKEIGGSCSQGGSSPSAAAARSVAAPDEDLGIEQVDIERH